MFKNLMSWKIGYPQISPSSSELVPSKSTKMSSGFTICTSHVTGPGDAGKSEDPKNKANLLWGKKETCLLSRERSHIPPTGKFGKSSSTPKWRLVGDMFPRSQEGKLGVKPFKFRHPNFQLCTNFRKISPAIASGQSLGCWLAGCQLCLFRQIFPVQFSNFAVYCSWSGSECSGKIILK